MWQQWGLCARVVSRLGGHLRVQRAILTPNTTARRSPQYVTDVCSITYNRSTVHTCIRACVREYVHAVSETNHRPDTVLRIRWRNTVMPVTGKATGVPQHRCSPNQAVRIGLPTWLGYVGRGQATSRQAQGARATAGAVPPQQEWWW